MPFKVCPKCNTKHGVRRLTCTCGYDFGGKRIVSIDETIAVEPSKRREAHKFPWPEPGTWIWDRPKGLPAICPPSDLPQGPLSAGIVKAQVGYEGLGFCIYNLIQADRVADSYLRVLWAQARITMQEIVSYLEQVSWEEGEELEVLESPDEVS
jgi:hypothetical protein